MSSASILKPDEWPDTSHLITEDDEPVDNPFQERQGRLLAETLYASWTDVVFLAFVNVGLFNTVNEVAIAPDLLVSLGVVPLHNPKRSKRHKAYFIWEYGKIPDLVVEVVSNKIGGEDTEKLERYARIGVPYYVIYDATRQLSPRPLRAYKLTGGRYVEYLDASKFRELGLGLTTWEGTYDGLRSSYLRFTDAQGQLLPTKGELVEAERVRADQQKSIAEEQRARAERLAARLRELGLDAE